ncbi:MAG: murQ [Phycisphaerales bacterium]|nr:murQ [Phycisphaerales bacterium]
MPDPALFSAIASVPAGAWAVGVSGGADSVALLALLRTRSDLHLHVVHLDHQTRGEESAADAQFVRELAHAWGIESTIAVRSEIEAGMANLPVNPSARFRAARMALFRRVVAVQRAAGVILAHHADDQTETILHRLLRGSGPMGLVAMERETDLGGLCILRPLLTVPRIEIRKHLAEIGQTWREDASNSSDKYLRNRLRQMLSEAPDLTAGVLKLGNACRTLRDWARANAPALPEAFRAAQLAGAPPQLAAEAARKWLTARGVPPGEISPDVTDRLLTMATDAASPARAHFPGRVLVRRQRGVISCGLPFVPGNSKIAIPMDRSHLLTEQRLPESMNLDAMSVADAVALMNAQDSVAVAAVATQQEPIARAIELVALALRGGGRLIYFGAGTSGRLGVLDAAECPPTFRTDPDLVQGVIAGGESAMFRAKEGAEDKAEDGASAADAKAVGLKDVVMGIAAGGTTPFVHGALRRARERGAKTIFLSCVQPVPDEPTVDVVIRPLTGPEVITGSTRLKAGTATKLVLNTISTLAMVRLGKVYGNLMVDLRATNSKLQDRARRIVQTVTGQSPERCEQLLAAADGHVKLAIVMHARGVDATAARDLLLAAGESLREAMGPGAR